MRYPKQPYEEWESNQPWYKSLIRARQRCNNKNNPAWKWYGGKGIKVLITFKEMKAIWIRDNGHKLENPSLDRIDSHGNYTVENCRFIEMIENSSKPCQERTKKVKKILPKGKFEIFNSIKEANESLGIFNRKSGGLSNHLNGKRSIYRGFKWEYCEVQDGKET